MDWVGLLEAFARAAPSPTRPEKAELELLIVALPLLLSMTSPLSLSTRLFLPASMLALARLVSSECP